MVARHADLWNFNGNDIDLFHHKLAVLGKHCAEVGRDREEIEFSVDPLPRNPAGKVLKNILRKTGTVSFPPESHL